MQGWALERGTAGTRRQHLKHLCGTAHPNNHPFLPPAASYFLAGATMTGGTITVEGCGSDSLQVGGAAGRTLKREPPRGVWGAVNALAGASGGCSGPGFRARVVACPPQPPRTAPCCVGRGRPGSGNDTARHRHCSAAAHQAAASSLLAPTPTPPPPPFPRTGRRALCRGDGPDGRQGGVGALLHHHHRWAAAGWAWGW